jgi:ribonuclease-3
MDTAAEDFERRLGYVFADRKLFEEALTHASYANETENSGCYERLEFLGDAVLELSVSEKLYASCPDLDEGGLSKVRSHVVRETTLASWALMLRLPELLKLSRGLEGQGGRDNPSILADVLEAVLGAIFLDGGYEASKTVVTNLMELNEDCMSGADDENSNKDVKSRLQEFLQARGDKPPVYRLINRTGPDHAASFEVEASMTDGSVISVGKGTSIKTAEFAAARAALSKISR